MPMRETSSVPYGKETFLAAVGYDFSANNHVNKVYKVANLLPQIIFSCCANSILSLQFDETNFDWITLPVTLATGRRNTDIIAIPKEADLCVSSNV